MSLPSINFLHLIVSEIQPGQNFSGHLTCPQAMWGSCTHLPFKLHSKDEYFERATAKKAFSESLFLNAMSIFKIIFNKFDWVE